jgi:hypothetical protein
MKLSRIITPAVVATFLALAPVAAFAQHGGGHGGGGHVGGGARMGGGSRAVGTAAPRGGGYYGGGAYYRGYGGFGYRGYGFGYALGAPYYAFSPRFGLGFGLYVGYPVGYPYWAFPDPYVYGYPYDGAEYPGYSGAPSTPPNGVTAAPSSGDTAGQAPAQGQYGGLSFQISPATAQVYVDGVYVGTVGQFSATTQPLTLAPKRHHVELRADGYQPMAFDVDVAPGQVIPYQGTMQSR